MAITDDASTPANVTGTGTGALATASFSPPAGALLVALVSDGWNSSLIPTATVADSVGGTWVPGPSIGNAASSTRGGVNIYTRQLVGAPGAMTVTATFTNDTGGRFMSVRVLNGAASSQAGAATATRDISVATTAWTQAIVTTAVNSLVLGVADDPVAAADLTAAAATSLIGTAFNNSTDGTAHAAFKQTTDTVTPGSTTLGLTDSISHTGVIAMLEILAAPPAATTPDSGYSPDGFLSPMNGPVPFGFFAPPSIYETTELTLPARILYENNAEGTPGATVATSDTGMGRPWDAVTIGTGASVVYANNGTAIENKSSISYDVAGTSASAFTQWTLPTGSGPHYAGFWFKYASTFGASASIFSLNTGGTAQARAQVTATDKLRILDNNGATVYTSTYTFTPGAMYYAALGIFAIAAGTYQVNIYDSTNTLVESIGPLAADFGGTVNNMRVGCVANQTNTNWRTLTVDAFQYNNYGMPVPALPQQYGAYRIGTSFVNGAQVINAPEPVSYSSGPMAGTVAGVTGHFVEVSKGTGPIAGTVAGVTGHFVEVSKTSGPIAGSLHSVTGAMVGTGKDSGPLAGTLGSITGDLNGTATSSGVTGVLAGSTHSITAAFAEVSKSSGPIAGTVAHTTAAFVEVSKASGPIAGSTHSITGAFVEVSKGTGPIAGSTHSITGAFAEVSKSSGPLAGTVHGVTSALAGTGKTSGPLAGSTHSITGHLTGSAAGGYINGFTKSITGAAVGTAKGSAILQHSVTGVTGRLDGTAKQAGVLAGSVAIVTADLNGVDKALGVLAGVLSLAVADLNGGSKASGPIAGTLSHVIGHFSPRSGDDGSEMMIFFHSTYGLNSYTRV